MITLSVTAHEGDLVVYIWSTGIVQTLDVLVESLPLSKTSVCCSIRRVITTNQTKVRFRLLKVSYDF